MLLKLALLVIVESIIAQQPDPRCPVTNSNPPLLLPHQSDCTRFYICHFGMALLSTCPSGLQFDTPSSSCREPPVICGEVTTNPPTVPPPTIPPPTVPPPTAPPTLPPTEPTTEPETDPTPPTEPTTETPPSAPEVVPTAPIIVPTAPPGTSP